MNKRLTVLLTLLLIVIAAKSQKDTIAEKGMLMFFEDRTIFFKTEITNSQDFLFSKADTGIEIIDAPRIPEILSKSEKFKVLFQTIENDHIVGDSIFISFAPANIIYKKKNIKEEPCSIAFNKDNKKVQFIFFCGQRRYQILNVFSNALHIKPWYLKTGKGRVL